MPAILRALIDLLKAYPGCFNSLKKVFVGGSVINISWSEEFMSLLDLDTYRIGCVFMILFTSYSTNVHILDVEPHNDGSNISIVN